MENNMEDTKWIIWSIEHGAWWRPESKGYTTHLSGAGVYSYKKALDIVAGANYCLTLEKPKRKFEKALETPQEAMILVTPQLEKQLTLA